MTTMMPWGSDPAHAHSAEQITEVQNISVYKKLLDELRHLKTLSMNIGRIGNKYGKNVAGQCAQEVFM